MLGQRHTNSALRLSFGAGAALRVWLSSLIYLQEYDKLLVTTWGHDPGVIPTSNILLTLNDALSHSAVLVQVSTHRA